MRYVLIAVASVVSAVVVGAAFLLYPEPEKPEAPKPVSVRYMPNEQLARELAPAAARFAGPTQLQVPPGFRCYSSENQRLRRVVVVCVA